MVAVSMMVLITAVAAAADQTPIRIGIIYRYSGGGPPMGKSLDAAIAAYQASSSNATTAASHPTSPGGWRKN
jgi:hypothetical protein